MTLYTHQSKNIAKTWLLMALFLGIVVGIGYFVSAYYGDPSILYIALVFSIVMNIGSYWFADKVALAISGAHPASETDYLELHRIVENLSITAGLPKPKVYIINDPSPNAFATGRNKEHAAIAVTTGLIERLDRSELEGVIAHELGHIGNKDILLQTVIVVLVGLIAMVSDWLLRISLYGRGDRDNKHPLFFIIGLVLVVFSPIIATLIQLAVSRKREFLADATGALLTRYPEGLASALEKIADHPRPLEKANKATAHLFILSPFGGDQNQDGIPDRHQKTSWLSKLFLTHPPVEERIKALRQ